MPDSKAKSKKAKRLSKEKFFWSYVSAMGDLQISRRTLQRWLDDLDIESLEFEDHMKVFLTLPHMQKLREYGSFMATRNQSLITRYRRAYENGSNQRLARLRSELADLEIANNNINNELSDSGQQEVYRTEKVLSGG